MATRIEDLTVFSKDVAKNLVHRVGTLKLVLSAGVIALSKLSAEEREAAIAEANGASGLDDAQKLNELKKLVLDYERAHLKGGSISAEQVKHDFYEIINKPLDQSRVEGDNSAESVDALRKAIAVMKQYTIDGNVNIEILSPEDRAVYNEVQKLLGPEKPKKKRKAESS